MIRTLPNVGSTVKNGSEVPGLTLTEHTPHWTFAADKDGHEWYADRLDGPGSAPAAKWTHTPSLCAECNKPRNFTRPMGVRNDA